MIYKNNKYCCQAKKMAADYVKNKKCFRRHLELSRHFDFLAWQQHIKK
jgi:hypothetical protein